MGDEDAADSQQPAPPAPWVYDVVTEHAALTTTGGRVWDAARRLCAYLEAMEAPLGLRRPGLRVLELGAGLGWLGMSLARNLAAAGEVVLTEQEAGGGVAWLRHNIGLNAGRRGLGAVRGEACDWLLFGARGETAGGTEGAGVEPPSEDGLREGGHAPAGGSSAAGQAEGPVGGNGRAEAGVAGRTETVAVKGGQAYEGGDATGPNAASGTGGGSDPGSAAGRSGSGGGDWVAGVHWDLVIGSDLVYNEIGAVHLPRVLRALARPGTTILYGHTKHRFDTFDVRFFEELAAQGLAVTEAHEPGVPSPPPSPPPLTELFPEMRIAVYDIRLAGAAPGEEGEGGGP
ncbi:hypothetical protein HYH03_018094 [Edaphochlamys debaryana]|uniref:Uncharacterized protein n=1 Tax=Edaphochlamys debaryana TaxID=47281 RepID=A0A835XGL7_9CHLO|nr:hypothetical protein HYH03_018094 [Edaphochlamys debaryana]|eukprot:KAG2483014.1 hypothetical protein HYH03_018094 [Edaphochlamys debaryana]